MRTVSMSQEAYNFIASYGGTLSKEPIYRRLDRFVANCQLSEEELRVRTEQQAKVIDFYSNRIKDLERDKQTSLVP